MAMVDQVQGRLRAVAYAVPKPWVAFGLAAALWAVIYGLGAQSVHMLRMVLS